MNLELKVTENYDMNVLLCEINGRAEYFRSQMTLDHNLDAVGIDLMHMSPNIL